MVSKVVGVWDREALKVDDRRGKQKVRSLGRGGRRVAVHIISKERKEKVRVFEAVRAISFEKTQLEVLAKLEDMFRRGGGPRSIKLGEVPISGT